MTATTIPITVIPKPGSATSTPVPIAKHKLGLVSMTLLVIGAMVGGGAFNLPQNMAQ